MKKQNYLMLLALVWVLSLACNDGGTLPDPQPDVEEFTTNDFNFIDFGIARVENLDPNDLGSTEHTHVNYSVVLSTADLQEVMYGNKNFFEIDLTSGTGNEISAVVFNLYAPITVEGGTAEENLLGGQSERVFQFENFAASGPGPNSYFFLSATLARWVLNDSENNRSFLFNEGTITLSGTAPNYTIGFDVTMKDNGRNIDGTLSGIVTGAFEVFENN